MASAAVQNQIAPPQVVKARNFNNSRLKESDNPTTQVEKNDVDFKNLLVNSNRDESARKDARTSGDLSGADSYEGFLEDLARQTDQQRAPKNNLDKDDFLKLFVTQLQHQDPLNPKDGAEMAAQLAQFHGLEQMMNVNKGIESLEGVQKANNSANLVNFIGKEVAVKGGKVSFKAGVHTPVEISSPGDISQTKLEVRDASGTLISSKTYGPVNKGKNLIKWDGKTTTGEQSPNGDYKFSLFSVKDDGSETPIDMKSIVSISGINLAAEDTTLKTEIGPLTFGEINSISNPLNNSEMARPDVVNTIKQNIDAAKQQAKATAAQLSAKAATPFAK